MDESSSLLQPIKAEILPISTATPPSSEPNLIKQGPPDITNTHPVDTPPPPFINSIKELRSLSSALTNFLRRYDELHDHLNFIKTSIDSKLPNHLLTTANPNQSTLIPSPETSSAHSITHVPETKPSGTAVNYEWSHENLRKPNSADVSKKPEETDISKNPEETDILKNPVETNISKKAEETDMSKKPEETDISRKPAVSELENLCERMYGREFKRYVTTHMSDLNKLRQEIPKALKFAKDPAKLVVESIGRFFLQGCKAYLKDSPQSVGRLASVLILECFLMMSSDGVEIAREEEENAAKAAVDWRRRMINEGGLGKTDETDARGLLLLISGFGIPARVFKNEDIRDLIRGSNVKGISTALRRSIVLIPKIPEIIDWMVKNNQEIEAVDIAYTFGLEDKCHPQTILKTFLLNKIKDRHHGAPQVKKAIKKQLSDLKSIRKCLEAHKFDPLKLLPDCNINEKILQLEKEWDELGSKAPEEKATQKRKAKEAAESSRKPKQHEAKRTRLRSHETVPSEPKAVVDLYGKSSYNGLRQASSSYFDGKLALHGSVLPENINSLVAFEGGAGLASGGLVTSSNGVGMYRSTIAEQMANKTIGQPCGWHDDSALLEKYLGRAYSRQVPAYDSQPSTTGLIGLYGRPSGPSLEAFPGLPNSAPSVGVSARGGPASDLYSFADTVVESESYRGSSRAAGSGTMRASYLY